jgi:flagellar biosynthesis protein FlhF
MRIKKFVGATIKDATTEMKRELGPNAIVIGTRRFTKGGIMNFLGREYVEITAALEDQAMEKKFESGGGHQPASKFITTYEKARQQSGIGESSGDEDLKSNLENLKRVAEQFSKQRANGGREKKSDETNPGNPLLKNYDLHKDMDQIKFTLREITDHMKYAKMPALPDTLKRIYENLIRQDVDERLAADIVQGIYGRLSEDQYADTTQAEQIVLDEISGIIRNIYVVKRTTRRKCKVIALVGPTGVGKTTTIAKLASIAKLMHQQDVGLISVDTFRIGAIEQLRTFATIADIPMEVVYKPEDMDQALRKMREKEAVFIDTVGRSQRMEKELADLASFVKAAKPDEIHLVMSASTNPLAMHDIAKRFKVMNPDRLVFSKLDEAVSFGPLLSLIHNHQIPLSYVTMGQNVPDDIIAVGPRRVASLIYRGVIPNA